MSADKVWEVGLGGPFCPLAQHIQVGLYVDVYLLPTAEACVEPQITPSYYTTSDAVISTETVFIVEISLTCKNRVQVRQWGFSQQVLGQEAGSEPGTWGISSSLAVDGVRPMYPCRQGE